MGLANSSFGKLKLDMANQSIFTAHLIVYEPSMISYFEYGVRIHAIYKSRPFPSTLDHAVITGKSPNSNSRGPLDSRRQCEFGLKTRSCFLHIRCYEAILLFCPSTFPAVNCAAGDSRSPTGPTSSAGVGISMFMKQEHP
ncbi:hypothetical protein I7I51_03407 [Histoplasma capsulatum]|uniref:Uncharacterized protein n=1 Tax=Ajellomyces capsulatus TaxID=5037 RepID=A0A8A1M6D2_AJECA|nr:hypothetical protein I7I51_03407 [Histoplasma capsulatum]